MTTSIGFIGYGKMAQALAKRLSHNPQYRLHAASPSLPSGKNVLGIDTTPCNQELVRQADIVVLAVKPAHMRQVLETIQPVIAAHQVFVSVASGLNLQWLTTQLPSGTPCIRAMPNIAAAVGQSATPLIANISTTAAQQQQVYTLFETVGICTWITKEHEMDTFTALSGSGPAYVFHFMQGLIDAAVQMGLEPTVAKAFTLQTLAGAVALAKESDQSLNTLTQDVTSPKGTTAAALAVFHHHHFQELIATAMNAARQRAIELGAQHSK